MRPIHRRPARPPSARQLPAPAEPEATVPAPATPKAEADTGTPSVEEPSMSLWEHLAELRSRLFRCLIAIFAGFVGVFALAPKIRGHLESILQASFPSGGEIIFIDLTEPLMVDMQLAFTMGIFVASPYIFYQIWAFIAPGLYASERKYVVPVAFCSALFFIAGGAFCYFIVIPFTSQFFISYGSASAKPLITLSNMFRYALRFFLVFGIMFELPLFSFFLGKLGIVTAARMRAWRKYAILTNFIIAALLTPPDVYSQVLLAGPLILLYEISIIIVAVSQAKAKDDPAGAT